MHFDKFNAVTGKEKLYLFITTPFSALPHHAHFQTRNIDKAKAFFKYTGP